MEGKSRLEFKQLVIPHSQEQRETPPFKERFYALIYSLDEGRVTLLLSYVAFSKKKNMATSSSKIRLLPLKGEKYGVERRTVQPGLCPYSLPLLCPVAFTPYIT